MITTWYLQSHRTWDKLCHSCIGSSFLPHGAFPEGRAYAVCQRLHAGSLEALRVSRPEAVVLAINNLGAAPTGVPPSGATPSNALMTWLRQQPAGHNILIAGAGNSQLYAGNGGDLLI